MGHSTILVWSVSALSQAALARVLAWMGPLASIIAWLVIAAAVLQNPWFVFTEHAFSDLGTAMARDPRLYNWGLIITGALVVLYSLGLGTAARSRGEHWGAAFTFVAGLFLALIGVYPGGTRPHVFVSTWFFVQMDLALLAWGLGLMASGMRRLGSAYVATALAAGAAGVLVPWPSAAVAEAFGIIVIDAWVWSNHFLVVRGRLGGLGG